jgi:hypothetical protein
MVRMSKEATANFQQQFRDKTTRVTTVEKKREGSQDKRGAHRLDWRRGRGGEGSQQIPTPQRNAHSSTQRQAY